MAIVPLRMIRRIGVLTAAAVLLVACVQQKGPLPPVEDRTGSASEVPRLPRAQPLHDGLPPDGHVVQAGDTLYGVAWRYGLDYRTVARINGIEPPYRIMVGQRLRLIDPGAAAGSPAVASGSAAPQPAMVPAEPSNRGFEYIPEPPAGSATQERRQETWQDMPPPIPGAPGVPVGSAPAPQAGSTPTGQVSNPTPGIPAASVPMVQAPATASGPAPQTAAVPSASQGHMPLPSAVPQSPASQPQPPAPQPSAPVDELPSSAVAEAQIPAPPLPPAAPAPGPARAASGTGGWRWPTSGSVVKGFGNGNKGIDFKLDPGKPVVAARGGRVVYAGNGLGGFRYLVILKHDDEYLSAYSFNWPIAVKEEQPIDAGGTIAVSDASAGGGSTLRFEIRRNAQPVDPAGIIGH